MTAAVIIKPRERPILFSAPMVLAILAGRKTVTRRLSSRYQVGDLLYVKEAWRVEHFDADAFEDEEDRCSLYLSWAADGHGKWVYCDELPPGWRMPKAAARGNVSPLLMPKWASRIWLEVTAIRKEKLQDITAESAIAEGVEIPGCACEVCVMTSSMCIGDQHDAVTGFASLWDRIHGEGAWASNPEVRAITFRRVT